MQGSFKASELAQAGPIRSSTGASGPTTPAPQNAALRAAHMANMKPHAQGASSGNAHDLSSFPQPWDTRILYNYFISAVDALLEYQLGRTGRFWPLDNHSFYTEHDRENPIVATSEEKVSSSASIVTINLYLNYAGTLIISCASSSSPPLVRLSRSLFESRVVSAKALTELPNGNLIRLAETSTTPPLKAGTTVFLCPAGLEVILERDCPSSRMMSSSKEDHPLTQIWKTQVEDVLFTKGIVLSELEDPIEWTPVKRRMESGEQKSFFWPTALCFCYREAISGEDFDKSDFEHPEYWFRQATDGGYKDPLHAVEEWVLSQSDRDKIKEERKRRKEQETAQKQAELQASEALSPFNARGTYADSQAVAGVYPTPPDGILSQTSGPAGAVELMATSGGEGAQGKSVDPTGNTTATSYLLDGTQIVTANDELFDGRDYDDDMGGNDITDADFSFFDQDDDYVGDQKQEPASAASEMENGPQTTVLVKQSPDMEIVPDAKDTSYQGEENVVKHSPSPDVAISRDIEPADHYSADGDDITIQRKILSPHTVQELLFSNHNGLNGVNASNRRQSGFAPLDFNDGVKETDTKYTKLGLFGDLSDVPASAKRKRTPSIDLTSPPSSKRRRISQVHNPTPQSRVRWDDGRLDSSGTSSDESDVDDGLSSAAATNGTSPQTAISEMSRTQRQPSPAKKEDIMIPFSMRHLKDAINTTVSLETRAKQRGLQAANARRDLARFLLSTFGHTVTHTVQKARKAMPALSPTNRSRASSPAVASSRSSPAPVVVSEQKRLKTTNKDYIKIAQIAAEQIIFSTLRSSNASFAVSKPVDFGYDNPLTAPLETVRAVINETFQDSQVCDLMKYASIQDPDPKQLSKNQPRPLPARANTGTSQAGETGQPVVVNLRAPHIRIRRNDALLDVLPPATAFWETLGLAPTSGPKNVMYYCLLPGNQGLKPQLMAFMESLGATYESCKLGSHLRGECRDGILYVNQQKSIESYALDDMLTAYRTCLSKFGALLAETKGARGIRAGEGYDSTPVDTFVIYVFNPFDDPSAVKELCVAFWGMYLKYSQVAVPADAKRPRPDIVLQILPISCIASSSLVAHETSMMQKLAREVYDRCPPAVPNEEKSKLRIYSGPSIQLEESLPKQIQFKLSAEAPSDPLHDPSQIHVGYARAGNWATAAWTDNAGRYQATASYCLHGSRTFFEVAREIWQTTLEIISGRKATWRISIARAGIPEREEQDAWMAQTTTTPSGFQIILFLVLVDPTPPVALLPKNLSIPTAQSGAPRTPVGTPQSGISPDTNQVGTPAATPSEVIQETLANDPDAHLVDVTDETYAVILGHRVNTSPSINDYRPSMSSGFMIRPNTGASPWNTEFDEGNEKTKMDYIAVHLLWIWMSNRTANSTTNPSPTSSQQSAPSSQPSSTSTPAPPPLQTSTSTPSSLSDAMSNIPPPSPATAVSQQAGQLGGSANLWPKQALDGLLRDTMGTYRNLAVLARVKGLRGVRAVGEGSLPWHILVSMRGVEGLEGAMGL